MSSEQAPQRNPLLVPFIAVGILAVVVIAFLLTRGGSDDPATKPTATPKTSAAPQAKTEKLEGSGDAPKGITVKEATVARSSTGFGLAADLPDIDVKAIDTVTLVLGQDSGKVLWNLRTFRDPRGAFITPELFKVVDGPDAQYACNGSRIRIAATQLSVTVPLVCLDDPKKGLQARLEITDKDGGAEKTSTSKVLSAPKS